MSLKGGLENAAARVVEMIFLSLLFANINDEPNFKRQRVSEVGPVEGSYNVDIMVPDGRNVPPTDAARNRGSLDILAEAAARSEMSDRDSSDSESDSQPDINSSPFIDYFSQNTVKTETQFRKAMLDLLIEDFIKHKEHLDQSFTNNFVINMNSIYQITGREIWIDRIARDLNLKDDLHLLTLLAVTEFRIYETITAPRNKVAMVAQLEIAYKRQAFIVMAIILKLYYSSTNDNVGNAPFEDHNLNELLKKLRIGLATANYEEINSTLKQYLGYHESEKVAN
eukprot:NODE_921_length_3087_cov_0.368474.p1 type:complete len:282 gc:universal NODE_921_length_3087_cov_0.368474:2585-1740(-)